MRTRTLILASAATSVSLLAASFLIASALRPDPAPAVDAPLTVPAAASEQAQVLLPVAEGSQALGLDVSTLDLSTVAGSLAVSVPEGDAPEVPASIVAAAAALDASAGDPAWEDAPASATAPPTPGSGEAPSEPGEPASDPCAPSEGEPSSTCPEGATATLLSLTGDGDFLVYAGADPLTGPGMGSSIWCDPATVADGALRLGALTTAPGTVTITYWPADNPADVHTAELAQVATTDTGTSRHCGATEPLGEGRYQGSAIAISADGVIASPYPLDFDSRGRPSIPTMRVTPIGTNWVWVGVYHTALESALIDGFPIVEGDALTCADASDPAYANVRVDLAPHTSEVPRDWLRGHNLNEAYTRVTSALLYLPEGTSAGICGLTYAQGEPSWDADVAEREQFTTVAAPDSWEAVVTVRDVRVYQGGTVQFEALSQLGGRCGSGFSETIDAPRSDTATTVELDREICRLSGQNVQLEVTTFSTTETGGSATAESRNRFALMGANCTGDCPQPEPRTYTVFLPGLGQDQCPDRATDDCELRRRTLGARATVEVTWERGRLGEGTGDARQTWGIGGVRDGAPSETPPNAARFDTDAALTATLAADGFSATASARLRWDRPVTYSVRTVGACFSGTVGADAPGVITGTASPLSSGVYGADINLRGLCPGNAYGLVVTFTDDAGNVQTAAPDGVEGVAPDVVWRGGVTTVEQRFLEVKAAIEVTRRDGVDASYLIRDSFVSVGYGRVAPSFGPYLNDRCFAGPSAGSESAVDRVELQRSYDIVPQLNIFTDWYYYPISPTCEWRRSDRWVPATNARVTLDQLLDGVVIEGTMVPFDLPPGSGEAPFSYRITLVAVPAED